MLRGEKVWHVYQPLSVCGQRTSFRTVHTKQSLSREHELWKSKTDKLGKSLGCKDGARRLVSHMRRSRQHSCRCRRDAGMHACIGAVHCCGAADFIGKKLGTRARGRISRCMLQ